MELIFNKRAFVTASSCCFCAIASYLIFGANKNQTLWFLVGFWGFGTFFFLALVLPNIAFLKEQNKKLSYESFIVPCLKSSVYNFLFYYGAGLSFVLFFGVNYYALIPFLVTVYLYFTAMTKVVFKFLGKETAYYKFGICGVIALAGTFFLFTNLPFKSLFWLPKESYLLIMPVTLLGYMIGWTLHYIKVREYWESFE